MTQKIPIPGADCGVIHEETVAEVRGKLPQDELLLDLADTFKLFADSTRVKILYSLLYAELCVCDIASVLGMTKSSVSHQLRILKQSNLVKYRKAGRVVYYSLADDHVKTIISVTMDHVME